MVAKKLAAIPHHTRTRLCNHSTTPATHCSDCTELARGKSVQQLRRFLFQAITTDPVFLFHASGQRCLFTRVVASKLNGVIADGGKAEREVATKTIRVRDQRAEMG